MKTKKIETAQGTTISYVEAGQGQPIVLLHGFVGDHHYWDLVMEPLAKHYRVIALDLPGHGDSSLSNQTSSMEDYADEVASFVQHLQLDKISLIGHSLGGYITMAFVDKYESLLDSFALVHSTALPDPEEAKAGRLAGMEKIQTEGIHSFVDTLVPKLFAPLHLGEFEQITKEIGYKASTKGAIAALGAMRERPDRVSVLETTKVPVLLLTGSEDGIVPAKRAFTTHGENIKQVLLPEVGHMSMYESPHRLIDELKQFLSSAR